MSEHLATALIVGGFPVVRRGCELILGGMSWLKVHGETGDAAQARELCEQHQPTLILLDLEVMEGDGLSLIGDFLRLHPAGRTLATHAREDADWLRQVFRAGAAGYLSKWDQPAELEIGLLHLAQWPHGFVSRRLSQRLSQQMMEELKAGRIGPAGGREVEGLSTRERAVFRLAGRGLGTSATARALGIDVKTVETHNRRIREKLGLASIDELRRRAAGWMVAVGGGRASRKQSA